MLALVIPWFHQTAEAAPDESVLLAVVEAGHAWLPPSCDRATGVQDPAATPQSWSSAPLTLLTRDGVAAVTASSPVCFPGECGADQVGVKVAASRAAGVLLRGTVDARPLVLVAVEGRDPYGRTPRRAPSSALPSCEPGSPPNVTKPWFTEPIHTCLAFGAGKGPDTWLLQVRGTGMMQENDYPLYQTIEARELAWANGAWRVGPWGDLAQSNATRLPEPVGRLVQSSGEQVVWLDQQGLCCPSHSKATTTASSGPDAWKVTGAVSGGRGQPCD